VTTHIDSDPIRLGALRADIAAWVAEVEDLTARGGLV
jgi:phosphoenolpyruvate carboxykinase (GTP)